MPFGIARKHYETVKAVALEYDNDMISFIFRQSPCRLARSPIGNENFVIISYIQR